ncbi:MAG: Holliday junction resolvase RuvX [Coriobacteriia bacterium]|nr:Holliday junction resolvase RuvX [Coriobacteriia bacterium]
MRIMALDLGEKRTGIAISDASGLLAHPLEVIPTHEVIGNAPSFKRLLDNYDVELLVVGLPVSLDGREHSQAARIRNMATQLETLYALPIVYADERLSSKEAKQVLRQLGYNEKNMRGKTDKIAACIMLQAWLENRPDCEPSTKRDR